MRIVHMQRVGTPSIEQGLLNQAVSFYNGGSRCMADTYITPLVTNSPMAPAIVCFAFAAELYLKLLHTIAVGSPSKGHDLKELFGVLPQEAQDAVAKEFGNGDLAGQINTASTAFVHWRYQHEHETLTVNLDTLINFAKAVHKVVRHLRPDLEVFGENHVARFFEAV